MDRDDKNVPPVSAFAEEKRPYVLCLYVTGLSPQSTQAVANLKAICREYLAGRYELEVIDLYQQPALARGEQIIAAPTLVKKRPAPPRRLVGNLSRPDRVLAGLDIHSEELGSA